MRFIKKFENDKEGYYVVVENESGVVENITVWSDVESARNYVTNIIHVNEAYDDEDYECKDMFDLTELLEYWNEKYPERYITFEYCFVEEKLELKAELKFRKEAKKYNL